MNDVAVLVGGKAGDGINSAGAMVAQLLNHLGYSIYVYFDYPSLIRGGIISPLSGARNNPKVRVPAERNLISSLPLTRQRWKNIRKTRPGIQPSSSMQIS